MPEMTREPQECEHKWVHLRKSDIYEYGYRKYRFDDVFFCEKCLAQKSIVNDIEERRSHAF